MADLSQTQSFTPANLISEPVVKRRAPVEGTTPLGMLELANTARSMTALQKEQALLQPSIEQGIAQSKKAQVELNDAQLKNIQGHHENIIKNIQDEFENPTVEGIIKRAKDLNTNQGGNEQSLKQSLMGLPVGGSKLELRAWLAQKQASITNSQAQLEKLYPAGVLPGQLPETSAAAGAEQQMGGKGAESISPNMELQYPVRNPNTPYLPIPGEKEATDVGAAYQSHASDVAAKLPRTVRNNQELISSIKQLQKDTPEFMQGGIAGEARLAFLKAKGDPRVVQLQKNLDNVISSTVTTFGKDGLSTDAGKALTAASTGKLNMPLDVLLNTAYRASGDLKNSELEATAVSKFTKKFGVNNIAAFQKVWGNNADRDVLQLKAMEDMGADKKDIEEFIFKGKTDKQIEELIKKEKNLNKLVEKGHL